MASDDRGEKLLASLVDLYLAEGFLSLGMGDLAARLRCSRSSLYLVASSKQQIILTAVRRYFRRAEDRVEARVLAEPDLGRRLAVALAAVGEELAPASEKFYADLAAYPPARELYAENTERAAQRIQDIVTAGVRAGALRPVDARFVGAAVAVVMNAIQEGRIEAAAGIDDAAAYASLGELVSLGLVPGGNPA
jgi:AcrR family transcriptional regulator